MPGGYFNQKRSNRYKIKVTYKTLHIFITQNVDSEENAAFGELSVTSDAKREVHYGIWFAKADGSEKCQEILKKIKNRPALGNDEKAKVTKQCDKYYIDERTDTQHVLVGIEGVVSKLYRNSIATGSVTSRRLSCMRYCIVTWRRTR